MEALILIGMQASGKSTFFKQRLADTHVRINLDMLRSRAREMVLLRACLEARQPFVVENTNCTREGRQRHIAPATNTDSIFSKFASSGPRAPSMGNR